ncbi:MAG TPA: hypothetical protein VGA18_05790, partial [Rhodothermales bacterium]
MSTVEDHSQPGGKSGRSLETTTASVPLREGAAEHKNPVCARHERKRSAQPGVVTCGRGLMTQEYK